MQIICKRKGGIGLPGVKLVYGSNMVDPGSWTQATDKVSPQWLGAMLHGEKGGEPQIVIASEGERIKPVKQMAAEITACEDIDQLNEWAEGEDRKTVLQAIEQRKRALGA